MKKWYRPPMTDAELELETSRQELQYLFFWFRTRCGDMEELCSCSKLTSRFIERRSRNLAAQKVGGRITDIEKQVEKLRKEWTRFLELKKKAEQDQ